MISSFFQRKNQKGIWIYHQRFDGRDELVKVQVDCIYKARICCPQLHVFVL